MKFLNISKYVLAVLAIGLLFVDWKIAIGVFALATLVHAFPLGPNTLLNAIAGDLIIGGLIYCFFDWRIGIALIIFGFLVIQFRLWAHRKNIDYYSKKK
ncbi:MAG: hypothetical protein AAB573_01215 [Patescibacteria group bacterium]